MLPRNFAGQKSPLKQSFALISLIDTSNKTGKGPSGVAMVAATKNPHAIAVKYALSGRDLQKNIRKTAKAVADQIAKSASSS